MSLFPRLLLSVLVFSSVVTVPILGSAKLPEVKDGAPLPSNLFVELAKLVNPSVVNISTASRPQNIQRRSPLRRDPFFDLFEQFLGPQSQVAPQRSLGTGFIIRKDGLIVTNNHVVANADIIKVQLSNNSEAMYEAKVVGRDKRTDVALIKINTKAPLPTVQLGTSKDLHVGEWVAAFGNPFGHTNSVTKGIISAIGREINEINRLPFIQTDASINPGNSGGPLVNVRGEVIGVNTAIDARAQGIGFAIPIDDIKAILPTLEKEGRIKRGYIGVFLADVDPRSAQTLNLRSTEGTLITQVEPDGPADSAGLEAYDFITKFGKKKIRSSNDLVRAVADVPVGSRAKVEILREGKKKIITIKITEHPEERERSSTQVKTYEGQKAPYELGFRVADMSRELRRKMSLPKTRQSHPVIIDVDLGSPASEAGLEPGDIIMDVNKKTVRKATDVLRYLEEDQINVLRIIKQGRPFLVYLNSSAE